MGIDLSTIHMTLQVLKNKKRAGNVLTCGVQGIEIQLEEAKFLFKNYGYAEVCLSKEDELSDDKTQYGATMHQKAYFKMLGYEQAESIDFIKDEGADFIHDLNEPISEALHEKFDLVYDGGCTEHIFNIREVMFNYVRLLKGKGMIMHHIPINGWANHGFFQFSPTFFYDFYRANGFTDLELYIQYRDRGSYHHYVKHVEGARFPMSGLGDDCLAFFIANKGSMKELKTPIQGHYS